MIKKLLPAVCAIFLVVILGFIIYTSIFLEPQKERPLPTVATQLVDGDEAVNKVIHAFYMKHAIDPNFRYSHVTNSLTTFFKDEPVALKVRNGRIIIQRILSGLEIGRDITLSSGTYDFYLGEISPSDYVGLEFPPRIGSSLLPGYRSPNYSKSPDDIWFNQVMEFVRMSSL